VRLSELLRDPEPLPPLSVRAARAKQAFLVEASKEVYSSFRDAARFLARADQRPLLILLFGALMVEWITEFYDAGMVVRQTLHLGDEAQRRIELAWNCAWMIGAALLPVLARWVGSLGKLFALTMLVDGVVIAAVGGFSGAGALVPVALLLGADHVLSTASSELAELAQNSASSAALRGRLAAFFAFVAIVGDIFAEVVSTALSEAYGVGGMLLRTGIAQIVILGALTLLGGRRFWAFGLRVEGAVSL
jgi:hypothetical protein